MQKFAYLRRHYQTNFLWDQTTVAALVTIAAREDFTPTSDILEAPGIVVAQQCVLRKCRDLEAEGFVVGDPACRPHTPQRFKATHLGKEAVKILEEN